MTVKICRVPIEISFWFTAVITLMILLFPQSNAAACFLLCVLHEIGHLLPMLIFGSRPKLIQLGYFGMKIETGERLLSASKEIIIAAFGPIVNLLSAAILYFAGIKDVALISLGLGIFNLLPVPMLDGGRILCVFIKNPKTMKIIGSISCFLLLSAGIVIAINTGRNFTFIAVALYLLTGIFRFS